MAFSDNFFKKIEKKTSVDKDTILSLSNKLQQGNMKDEGTLKEVKEILEERGYNPYNQIVGYLMSGDVGYISSHKEARKKILDFERAEILEVLVKNFLS